MRAISIAAADTWLSTNLPPIIDYANAHHGVVFLTWDESEGGSFPIGMIALGPTARTGYVSSMHFTHGSLLRSVETIFGVPFLGDANSQSDLGDLFTSFP